MNIPRLFAEFFDSEKAGGVVLLIMTLLSLFFANSSLLPGYLDFWEKEVGSHSLQEWINDGLMAVFFLLIGLELEREIYDGELSNLKKASLPIFAAAGGMVIPALIYLAFNIDTIYKDGAGVPVATDIAFAIGVLSLLGSRVPLSLKIFLTALAVIDDLGAIIIIAVFYSGKLSLLYLAAALGIFGLLILLNRLKYHRLWIYLISGVAMWYFMLHSGIHATLAGVMLAFAIPFSGGEKSPSYVLQHHLHKPVAFFILPLFALANTAVTIDQGFFNDITQQYGIGIIAGLVIGKPAGIFIFSRLAALSGISEKPGDIKWTDILGIGMLGGIGFTMSIFILLLAFDDPDIINNAKAAILVASLISGLAGYILLKSRLASQILSDPDKSDSSSE